MQLLKLYNKNYDNYYQEIAAAIYNTILVITGRLLLTTKSVAMDCNGRHILLPLLGIAVVMCLKGADGQGYVV